ncbi:MAG: hypothetical protein IJN74_03220 [Clostridia bacterium]|nr:hypothetical protein [Clostridia bacterium]
MAKSKKRSSVKNAKRETGLSTSSAHALMAAAEEVEVNPDVEEESPKAEDKKPEVHKEKDAEKEMLLSIVTRLMDDMGAESLQELSEMIDKAEERKLISVHGLSEDAAKLFLSQQEKVRALRRAEKSAEREAVYAKMRQDPLYDDVDERRPSLEALILKTGISPKEAYLALFAEERLRSLLSDMESKETESKKKAKNIPALSGGEAPDAPRHAKLTEMESRLAKKAGMTPEEYAKYKYAY